MFLYFFVLSTPKLHNTLGFTETIGLPHDFSNWGHYECKILDETFIKLSHSIEYLNMLWIYGYKHLNYMALGFFKNLILDLG